MVHSARFDGVNDLQILIRIVLPLSKAAIAVVALLYAAYWNDFFTALLYLNSNAMWPLSLVLHARRPERSQQRLIADPRNSFEKGAARVHCLRLVSRLASLRL